MDNIYAEDAKEKEAVQEESTVDENKFLEDKYVVGRVLDTQVKGIKLDDNTWEVTYICRESFSRGGEEWDSETLAFKSVDKSFDTAHKAVVTAYINWMNEHVFTPGYNSLILAIRDQNLQETTSEDEEGNTD